MHKQQSKEWFTQRVGLITGSKVGGILGTSPFAKPEDVMRDMVREYHGAEREFTGNVATEYGNDNEDVAIFQFEAESNLKVTETGFHVHANGWLGASPDGLVGDDAVIEIKCPYGKRNAQSMSEFKSIGEQPNYYGQMQIEMYCTDTQKCHFYQWAENASNYELIPRDDAWLDENLPKLKAFHDEYLQTIADEKLSKPYLEDKEIDKSNDSEWLKLEAEYMALKSDFDAAKEMLEASKQKLIDAANGRKCTSNELTVFKVSRKGAIKYAQIIKDQGIQFDTEKYQGKSSESWTIKVK